MSGRSSARIFWRVSGQRASPAELEFQFWGRGPWVSNWSPPNSVPECSGNSHIGRSDHSSNSSSRRIPYYTCSSFSVPLTSNLDPFSCYLWSELPVVWTRALLISGSNCGIVFLILWPDLWPVFERGCVDGMLGFWYWTCFENYSFCLSSSGQLRTLGQTRRFDRSVWRRLTFCRCRSVWDSTLIRTSQTGLIVIIRILSLN